MQQGSPAPNEHETVGAYALGILDDAEATAFEAHLATCEWCAQQLDELAGMEPMLAALADLPGSGTPTIGESLSAKPAPRMAEKLVDEVVVQRTQKRRRTFFMLAASVALIIAGPLAAMAASGGDSGGGTAVQAGASSAQSVFDKLPAKVSGTDPSTKVTATVGMEKKAWGTEAVVKLNNVAGPNKCSLIAVGKNGERETISTWAVPEWGYGLPGAKTEQAKNPLYVQGGAAFTPDQIDHFEVIDFDGKKLVQIDA
ncbi:anti-sigma factor [Streptomyces griseus]|uniref:anti-sigma factor family protein n=1 Tax=Streptomyces griseus TaxID=1911 RepID=UPI000AE7EA00|nr:zf-HC2 domain-containing protein [Streptomyces griseus]